MIYAFAVTGVYLSGVLFGGAFLTRKDRQLEDTLELVSDEFPGRREEP